MKFNSATLLGSEHVMFSTTFRFLFLAFFFAAFAFLVWFFGFAPAANTRPDGGQAVNQINGAAGEGANNRGIADAYSV